MIRPSHFGYNKQTADSNAFQKEALTWHLEANIKARSEFDEFAAKLSADGISTYVFDEDNPDTPDAVFPNNWISFHESGKVVLYPMMAENRRAERRQDILYRLEKDFDVAEVLDLSLLDQLPHRSVAAVLPEDQRHSLPDLQDRVGDLFGRAESAQWRA